MSLFAIGDTHLSLGVNKPMTIFSGWDQYVERLENNWRRIVKDGDTVVIAGDISWGMSLDQALPDLAFLHSLPGKKMLFKGNHDYWWTTRHKMDSYFSDNGLTSLQIVHNDAVAVDDRVAVCGSRGWFNDDGVQADHKILLREAGRLRASITAAKQTGLEPIVFLHYPPLFAEERCEELLQVLQEEEITHCYYGHVHSAGIRMAFNGTDNGIHYQLISADALGFCPLLIPYK